MPYVIFNSASNCVYKIAEKENDLNNLNLVKSDYKIIEVNNEEFNSLKLNKKICSSIVENSFFFENMYNSFDIESLQNYINNFIKQIELFLNSNTNHVDFYKWQNYKNLLISLKPSEIVPLIDFIDKNGNKTTDYGILNQSLEEYLESKNVPSLNILQIP